MRLILIGPQGSGKGTQAQIITDKLNIPHISTGDLLKSAKGELKKEIDPYINKGNLVPDELTTKLLKQRINQPDCKNGFILDGFPRNLNQVKLLKQITDIDKVIEITTSDEFAIKRISNRLSCKKCHTIYNKITNPPKKPNTCNKCNSPLYQREDDYPEAIKKRLNIYKKETTPIIEKYKGRLIKINGNQSIKKVSEEILSNLKLK